MQAEFKFEAASVFEKKNSLLHLVSKYGFTKLNSRKQWSLNS